MKNTDLKSKVVSAAVWVTAISAVGKLLGLMRESSLANYFGASVATDAFKVAFNIPDIIIGIFGAAIVQTFIPVYNETLQKGDEKESQRFLNNFFTISLLISLIIMTVGVFASSFLVRLIAPGMDEVTANCAAQLAVIMMPGAVFMIMANIATGYLQAHGRFIAAALTWYFYNLFMIGSMVFFHRMGINAVGVGALLGIASMLLVQLPSMKKEGLRYRPVIDFKDKGLRTIGFLLGPVLISSAFNQVYIIINRMLASGLDKGSISSMDYAYRVNVLYYTIFILSISSVVYPLMARYGDNLGKFTGLVAKTLRVVTFVSLPISVLFFILRFPILQLLFQRGAFSSSDTARTAVALAGFSVGIIGTAYRDILNRAFYALKDTRTPMINGVIAIILNIGLNLILIRFGIVGLALGSSIAATISAGMLIARLKSKVGKIQGNRIFDGFYKSALASLIMGICVYFIESQLTGRLHLYGSFIKLSINLTASILGAGLVYTAVLFILRVEELQEGFLMIKNKVSSILLKKSGETI